MIVQPVLVVAAALFSLGIYGILVRRNAVMVLLSIELILNSVNINFIMFDTMLADTLMKATIRRTIAIRQGSSAECDKLWQHQQELLWRLHFLWRHETEPTEDYVCAGATTRSPLVASHCSLSLHQCLSAKFERTDKIGQSILGW